MGSDSNSFAILGDLKRRTKFPAFAELPAAACRISHSICSPMIPIAAASFPSVALRGLLPTSMRAKAGCNRLARPHTACCVSPKCSRHPRAMGTSCKTCASTTACGIPSLWIFASSRGLMVQTFEPRP